MHDSSLIFPLDLEFSNTGLLNKNVTSKLVYLRDNRRILIQLLILIVVVYIVANSEEFLIIVRASQEDTSDSNNIILRNARNIWLISL
jgi:hypothetical protein